MLSAKGCCNMQKITDLNVFGYLNDLWKYNPDTYQWTWMSGSDIINQPGTYRTTGVPSVKIYQVPALVALTGPIHPVTSGYLAELGILHQMFLGSLSQQWHSVKNKYEHHTLIYL